MLMSEPAQFVKTFVNDLAAALGKLKPNAKLTPLQQIWLGFCLTGILLTRSVCWAKFERANLGGYPSRRRQARGLGNALQDRRDR